MALAVAVLAASTLGEDDAERFRLFADCAPVGIYVVGFPDEHAAAIGLTKESVELAAQSRLRAARLYSTFDKSRVDLWIAVHLTEYAAVVSVEFKKRVIDTESWTEGYVRTWSAEVFGTHGDNSSGVQGKLSELMDRFIDAYLRVNEAACKAKEQES